MNLFVLFAFAALSLIHPARAASPAEAVFAAGFADFQTLGIPDQGLRKTAEVLRIRAASRNPVGAVTGAANHSLVELYFDRRTWEITGGANRSPVRLSIDHQKGLITVGANHSPVELRFTWTPERIVYEGGANRSPVRLELDWIKGRLEGNSNNSPVLLEFDLEQGWVRGHAAGSPVQLQYDAVRGTITGAMNHSPADLRLVNLDLSDFLQHIYLFLAE